MNIQKSAFALGIAFVGMLAAGVANAADGNVTIQNGTTGSTIGRTASFGAWTTLPALSIGTGSSSLGTNTFTNGSIIVRDVTYRDPVSTRGCNFRVHTQLSGSICQVVLTPNPVGSSGGTVATCTGTLNSVNSTTCSFNATFRVSGF